MSFPGSALGSGAGQVVDMQLEGSRRGGERGCPALGATAGAGKGREGAAGLQHSDCGGRWLHAATWGHW